VVRFLHSSDWQLGMTRYFLGSEAQARFSGARVEAIETLGRLARDENAAFVVVAGDVFETNLVPAEVVTRALDAMRDAGVPFYLLPGNHDPLAPGSIYESERFVKRKPGNVHVLGPEPVQAAPGTWVAGVPWRSKQAPPAVQIAEVAAALGRCDGVRVLVLHGQVEGAPEAAVTIERAWIEAVMREQGIDYVALGDRHSVTDIGCRGRAWYSGTTEPTDYDELEPGKALLIDLEGDSCQVRRVQVGRWRFVERALEVTTEEELRAGVAGLDALPERGRTILRLRVRGTGGPELQAAIEAAVAELAQSFAAVEPWERYAEFVVRATGESWESLGLVGFAAATGRELDTAAAGDGEGARVAGDALALLFRLARGPA
jgi:DNA repair exonuclease SbcCD nuclease subunit